MRHATIVTTSCVILFLTAAAALGYDPDPDGSLRRAGADREGWRNLLMLVGAGALLLGLVGLVIRSAVRSANRPKPPPAAAAPTKRPAGYAGAKSLNMPDDSHGG